MILHNKKKRGGFTLVETLVVVGIIVVLLALAVVDVLAWRSHLKLLELDNAAREIYMAAQNRMELLNSGDRVDTNPLAARTGNTVKSPGNADRCYLDSKDAVEMGRLLPAGTIDPTLWSGRFYVVYDPKSASVTDVFYAEDEFEANFNFSTFYHDAANYDTKNARRTGTPMVGYYGGEAGDPGDAVTLDAPIVIIHNENELWAEITWSLPKSVKEEDVKLEVTLTYGDQHVTIDPTSTDPRMQLSNNLNISTGKNDFAMKYVIDSLESGKQFKDLMSWPKELGGDFTLSARLVPANDDSGVLPTVAGSDTDNSLYAESTTDDVACIANMRHLQNLEQSFSCGTDEKLLPGRQQAKQIADITNPEDPNHPGNPYPFRPINDDEHQLELYDGQEFEIRGLLVELSAAADAGLFGTKNQGGEIKNVRLVNAQVSGGSAANTTVGALCGSANGVTFDNCWSYWEQLDPDDTSNDLRGLLGTANSENDTDPYKIKEDKYMVTGNIAGGLVGHAQNAKFEKCLAAATVKGSTVTGGLVGAMEGAGNEIDSSYADCYLAGDGKIAGMVGELATSSTGPVVTITGSYTAGFIYAGTGTPAVTTAGLCLGDGSAETHNSYTAMAYSAMATEPLAANGTGTNTYWVKSDFTPNTSPVGGEGKTYDEFIKSTSWTPLFDGTPSPFTRGTNRTSNPYNLQADKSLTRYPYPAIPGVDHYGDWGILLTSGGLVYVEYYDNGTYGLAGSGFSTLKTAEDNRVITQDKYGVVLSQAQVEWLKESGIQITYTLDGKPLVGPVAYSKDNYETVETSGVVKDANGAETLIKFTIKKQNSTDEDDYYVVILPEELLNLVTPTGDFYHTLKCEIAKTGSTADKTNAEWLYNPHFAATVLEPDEGETAGELSKQVRARVRTPRHLYWLSMSANYYNNSTNAYTFLQELNLVYGDYKYMDSVSDADKTKLNNVDKIGSKGFMGSQEPIGPSESDPFRETYNGGGHTVTGVPLTSTKSAATPGTTEALGLFGVNNSAITGLAWLGNGVTGTDTLTLTGSASANNATVYVGGLVGLNRGTITNCATAYMRVEANGTDYADLYAGGLVGSNSGVISNCSSAVEHVFVTALYSGARAGGLVGENTSQGAISSSYAVGYVRAERDGDQTVLAGGLAGNNSGSIGQCYAACRLTVNGGATERGLNHGAASSNSYYLDKGNFTWLGDTFSAQYADAATSITWNQLTDENALTDGDKASKLGGAFGMNANTDKTDTTYPMPAVVTKAGETGCHHYGPWPEPMELGTLGVFYWETEAALDGNGKPIPETEALHFSVISVDTVNHEAWKDSTLCEEHDDGKVIVDYGYGYYHDYNEGTLPDNFFNYGITDNTATYAFSKDCFEDDKRLDGNGGRDDIEGQLQELMGGEASGYHFVAYRTTKRWERLEDIKNTGLKLLGIDQWGTWTFTVPIGGDDTATYKFILTPYFGDALALDKGSVTNNKLDTQPDGRTAAPVGSLDDEDADDAPGAVNGPAYQVRSVEQLQYINSYVVPGYEVDPGNFDPFHPEKIPTQLEITTAQGMESYYNVQYPFLCWTWDDYDENKGVWDFTGYTDHQYWVQSHDLQGVQAITYSSIAALENNAADMYGWFGGTYDGQNYRILELNIKGDGCATVGLFGATLDADLKNIIMYSPSGKATVTRTGSGWYGLGGLVGLAANSDGSDHKIENCTVAGYTISDQSTWDDDAINGGAAVGGLVGICNMDLSGCTAVNTIEANWNYAPEVNEPDQGGNYRAGGIAGTCQASITNCYAGGEMLLASDDAKNCAANPGKGGNLHIGGVFAGSSMRTLQLHFGEAQKVIKNDTSKQINVTNCYNYFVLPEMNVDPDDKEANHLYAIGGTAEHQGEQPTVFDNCYYLRSYVLKELVKNSTYKDVIKDKLCDLNDKDRVGPTDRNVTWLTYEQMSSSPENPIPGGQQENFIKGYNNFTEALNEGGTVKGTFANVTTTVKGGSVNGKYSFPSEKYLEGLDYPFPTILTQNNAADGKVNVHYGDWPIAGIQRRDGKGNTEPVTVGLFANYHDGSDGKEKGSYYDLPLTVSEILRDAYPGGTITVTIDPMEVPDETDPSGKKKVDIASLELLDKDNNVVSTGSTTLALPHNGVYDFGVRIKWLAEGTAMLHVTYGNAAGTDYATLDLTVSTVAELLVNPALAGADRTLTTAQDLDINAPVVFRGLTSEIDLYAFDNGNRPISPDMTGLTVTVKDVTTSDDRVESVDWAPVEGAEAWKRLGTATIKAKADAVESDDPIALAVTYTYTYTQGTQSTTKEVTNNVFVYPMTPTVEAETLEYYVDQFPVTVNVKNVLTFKAGDTEFTPEDLVINPVDDPDAIVKAEFIPPETDPVVTEPTLTFTVPVVDDLPHPLPEEAPVVKFAIGPFTYGLARHSDCTAEVRVQLKHRLTVTDENSEAVNETDGLTFIVGGTEKTVILTPKLEEKTVSAGKYDFVLSDELKDYFKEIVVESNGARTITLKEPLDLPEGELKGTLTVTAKSSDDEEATTIDTLYIPVTVKGPDPVDPGTGGGEPDPGSDPGYNEGPGIVDPPQNGAPEIDGPAIDEPSADPAATDPNVEPAARNALPEFDGPVVDAPPAPQDGLPEIDGPDAGAPESAPPENSGAPEPGGQPEEESGIAPQAEELPPSAPVAALPPRQETGETPKGSSGPEGGGDPGQPSGPKESGDPAS